MNIDPLPEDVRKYVREHFADVRDEPAQHDYYCFSITLSSGKRREMKVHRNLFSFPELVPAYLRDHDFAAQLERGNVKIAEPLRS